MLYFDRQETKLASSPKETNVTPFGIFAFIYKPTSIRPKVGSWLLPKYLSLSLNEIIESVFFVKAVIIAVSQTLAFKPSFSGWPSTPKILLSFLQEAKAIKTQNKSVVFFKMFKL